MNLSLPFKENLKFFHYPKSEVVRSSLISLENYVETSQHEDSRIKVDASSKHSHIIYSQFLKSTHSQLPLSQEVTRQNPVKAPQYAQTIEMASAEITNKIQQVLELLHCFQNLP